MTDPATKEELEAKFAEELRDLVLRAYANGVDIEGLWEADTEPSGLPSWDVTIQSADPISTGEHATTGVRSHTEE